MKTRYEGGSRRIKYGLLEGLGRRYLVLGWHSYNMYYKPQIGISKKKKEKRKSSMFSKNYKGETSRHTTIVLLLISY